MKAGLAAKEWIVPPADDLWRLAVTVPGTAREAMQAALESLAVSVAAYAHDELATERGAWTIEALAEGAPDLAAARTALALAAASAGIDEPALDVSAVGTRDWVAAVMADQPPIRLGRFHVRGGHVPAAKGGLRDVRIDTATAFGSGEHGSTAGCLLALDALARRRLRVRRALDMGSGSGILAIALARAWRAQVLGIDIDPHAARVARENVAANRLGRRVRILAGRGYAVPAVRCGAPYDLIAANILAHPLARMARSLHRVLAPRGTAVLSGLLRRQEGVVLGAHRPFGLRLQRRHQRGAWSTLVLKRRRRR